MSHQYLSVDTLSKKFFYHRKIVKGLTHPAASTLPEDATLKPYSDACAPTLPYEQGTLGSCTANAFCASYVMQQMITNGSVSFHPSRLYVYYFERLIENTEPMGDTGADIKDGITYVQNNGVCQEGLWPYSDVNEETHPGLISYPYETLPDNNYKADALLHKLSSHYTINPFDPKVLDLIKEAIIAKLPVLIAIAVYQSFESTKVDLTGLVPLPNPKTYWNSNDPQDKFLGGHEMCLVGYDDQSQLFTVLNSWGPQWGQKGYCYLPYPYLSNPQLTVELSVFSI